MLLPPDLVAFVAVAVGAFLEGEVAILSATVLSMRGPFQHHTVFVAGVLGTALGDHLVYWIGRTVRDPAQTRLFGRRPVSPALVARLRSHFARHGAATVLALRFAYGTRSAGFFLAGAGKMHYARFAAAELLAAALWTGALVGLGLLAGPRILRFFDRGGGWALLGGMLAFGALVALVITLQRRLTSPRV